MEKQHSFATMAIHGNEHKNALGALATPIYQTSTFCFDSAEQGGRRFAGKEDGYIYTRLGNPTNRALEEKLALLEGGEDAVVTSSGMGAIATVLWTLLKAGDHVLADKTLYGCTFALLSHGLTKFGVEVSFVDTSDMNEVKKALKKNTRLVYFESPANPNMKVIDIELLAKTAHAFNSEILVVMDNTFNTPYITKPLSLGCDVVVHSATKYLNGHGDVVAGAAIASKALVDGFRGVGLKDMTGAVLSPNDAFLILRGLKTLDVRMARHCENGVRVARYLDTAKGVKKVYYPGLESFEGHKVAEKQMHGFGGTMSFEIEGGLEAGIRFINALRLCSPAVSLGDCETLVQHPASMTHSGYNKEEREEAGITDGLIRVSVGLEDADEIIEDMANALKAASK